MNKKELTIVNNFVKDVNNRKSDVKINKVDLVNMEITYNVPYDVLEFCGEISEHESALELIEEISEIINEDLQRMIDDLESSKLYPQT